MYFDWNYKIQGFLFENFNIDTLEKCILIIIAVFCLAYTTESIKLIQKIINKKFQINWMQTSVNSQSNEQTPLVQPLRIPASRDELKKRRLQNHIIQSLLYMLNLTIGYFLMNIVMVMYAGHFISIILGFVFGYFFLNVMSPDFYASVSNESIGINSNNYSQPTVSGYRSTNSNNYENI